MARNKRKRNRESFFSRIAPETKKSALAILLFGAAVLLALGSLGRAGPAGDFIFTLLERFFGWGYYLLPLMAVLVALMFIFSREEKFFGLTFMGALLSILFGLGVIDIILPGRGGWIGRGIGALEAPFGAPAALIIEITLILISLLVTFDASLIINRSERKERRRKPELNENEEVAIAASAEVADTEENESGEEIDGGVYEGREGEDEEPLIAAPAAAAARGARSLPSFSSEKYTPPPLSLIKSAIEKPTSGDLRANANIIKRTLEGFGIPVEMSEINIGPKVTRYTLKPAEGVKLARITALNSDLALALAAHPIRIEAPIPGKSLVGIEVPNKSAALVRLGSLMAYPEFGDPAKLLSFPLGRDVTGEPLFINLEKLPHMLVAGSTGSGKSIAIHSLLISLLYKNSPETLRLILIDPKRVELSSYNDLPHLVAPVITEAKRSVGVFRWAIAEMERRYETLLNVGARDILSYNKKAESSKKERMPYIVIVVDEMADLMTTYGRDIESSIVRLAQMARATGIHLILSTQRPSVEVITGLIKANITGRIALQVASQIDSRTILDSAGAEKLLGGGDLLYMSSDSSKPRRIQGAYITEDEIKKVTDFIREHNDTIELSALAAGEERGEEGIPSGALFDEYENGDGDDELFEEATAVVREAGKASASLLQRRLKVGYARAARLLDIMEAKGLVGPADGAKPRDVFMD